MPEEYVLRSLSSLLTAVVLVAVRVEERIKSTEYVSRHPVCVCLCLPARYMSLIELSMMRAVENVQLLAGLSLEASNPAEQSLPLYCDSTTVTKMKMSVSSTSTLLAMY